MKRKSDERNCRCKNKHRGRVRVLLRLIAHMDFAIVGFCRVKGVKSFPVVASGDSLNELII